MTNRALRKLAIIDDGSAPRSERVQAAKELSRWAQLGHLSADDVQAVFERISALWRGLCDSPEPASLPFFHDRTVAASACTTLSQRLPEGQSFFRNIPRHGDAEGPDPAKKGSMVRGAFEYTYGSIYEFHLEYPINGFGVRKNLISIVETTGERTPLFQWLREQDAIIWCTRCGLEITYEISRNCQARTMGGKTGALGP